MESMKVVSGVDRMTRFERLVVFRVARGYFFVMAVGAVLLFIGGVVLGVRSLAKSEVPKPAPVPALPDRAPLTYAQVLERLKEAAARSNAGTTLSVEGKAGADSADAELEAASKELRAAFPDPPYSWENELEKVCSAPTSFGCLQWGTRIKREGVVGALSTALRGTSRDELLGYLRVLTRVLKEAPVEKRLELAPAVIAAERDARERHEAAVKKHQGDVRAVDEKYEADLAANELKYAQWRQGGIYGVAAGFTLLIVVSLFLAFLSMERHTRALEQLTRQLSGGALPRRDEAA